MNDPAMPFRRVVIGPAAATVAVNICHWDAWLLLLLLLRLMLMVVRHMPAVSVDQVPVPVNALPLGL